MRRICSVLLLVLILSLAMWVIGCGAKFELSSLEVSPAVCVSGETVTVSTTVANTSDTALNHVAELLVNGTVEQVEILTAEPGSSQSLSFTLVKVEPGKYDVQLGKLTSSFTVLGVSNLQLSSSEVEVDQPITVTADLHNVAETPATYHCCLLCRGREVEARDITVAGGSTDKVSFTFSQAASGTHEVELLGTSRSIKVFKPAEFRVASLDVTPDLVKVGQQATVTATIGNVGDVEGTYNASLLLDSQVYHTSDITLAGGATESVSVVVSKDSPGSYSIEIGGREATLEVIEPVQLETGTLMLEKRGIKVGDAKLDFSNRTIADIIVVLALSEEPEVPVLAYYIQSEDSFVIKAITDGTYVLYVMVGEGWDEDSQKFLIDPHYHQFIDEFRFHSGGRITTWYITCTKMMLLVNAQPLSEDEFPKFK